MTIKLGEIVADQFVKGLDMTHLTAVQVWILHGIKSIAMSEWAQQTLKQERGY